MRKRRVIAQTLTIMTECQTEEPGTGEDTPRKRRLSLAQQVLIGLGLGIVAGVFFGEMVGWLKVVGDVFIRLLQVTVIPYISLSLITSLGAMQFHDVKELAFKGGAVLLAIWAITLAVVLLMPLSFPIWPSASFFSTSLIEEPQSPDYLRLFIPSNPFYSYANALVPAVVMFSILVGIGLIGIKEKNAALEPLSVIRDTLMWVTSIISKLAPLGVFALMANAVGTTDFEDLARLQVYIVLYALIALFLGLWVLPALVCALTPLRYGDVMRALRTPLITAFATGSAMIVLPLLIEQCKRLIVDTKMFGVEAQEQADASVKTLIPTAFTFPSAASLLVLSFVLFAGWYIGSTVSVGAYPSLILAGVPSLFGGSLLTVPFLLDLLRLPNDLFQLFLAVDVINSRFGTLLAAMYYAAIGLLGTIALVGRLRFRWVPLTRFVLVSAALITTVLLGVRVFYTHVVIAPYTKADMMKRLHLLSHPQPATVHSDVSETLVRAVQGPASLAEIKDRGVLRVCYAPKTYPSAFFNTADPPQLVGFDIEMAHRFARRIQLPIEFLPVTDQVQAAESLDAGTCDILMVSLPISVRSSQRFAMASPTYNSPVGVIVRDHRRDSFRSWKEIQQGGTAVRVAVPPAPDSISSAKSLLPEATLMPWSTSEEVKTMLESGARDVDAILHVAENAAALTLLYPEFSVVVPTPKVFVPLGYSVALGNEELLRTLNAWLGEQKANGTVDELYRYWMLGQAAQTDKPPRWSVIRDVLGWIN